MEFNSDNVWKESILVFDSCSILRLYEWCLEKSFELQDIFDCKTQDIILLEQVKKETLNIYSSRIEEKKDKYIDAINYLSNVEDKQKAITTLKKQCDGFKYSDEFMFLLRDYIDGKVSYDEIIMFVNRNDEQVNQYIEGNKLEFILNNFFTQEYHSKISEEELEKKYSNDIQKGLPGNKDKGKSKNSNGDYIILNQLVEVTNDKGKNITFVTADVKPDWFPFNKKLKGRELNPAVIEWFNNEITNSSKINVINLSEILTISKNYISSEISSLVDEEIIYNLIDETYGTWYPEELMGRITEYIEEDGNIQLEIEDAIDSCLDNLTFGETEDYKVKDITYEIEEDEVIISIYADFFLTLDASAHCDREDRELGSPSCHFSGLVRGSIPVEWESKNTGAISIGSQLEDISIEYIDFLGAESLYPDEDECDEENCDIDDYDEDNYDEEYNDIDDYDEDDYYEECYDLDDYNEDNTYLD